MCVCSVRTATGSSQCPPRRRGPSVTNPLVAALPEKKGYCESRRGVSYATYPGLLVILGSRCYWCIRVEVSVYPDCAHLDGQQIGYPAGPHTSPCLQRLASEPTRPLPEAPKPVPGLSGALRRGRSYTAQSTGYQPYLLDLCYTQVISRIAWES